MTTYVESKKTRIEAGFTTTKHRIITDTKAELANLAKLFSLDIISDDPDFLANPLEAYDAHILFPTILLSKLGPGIKVTPEEYEYLVSQKKKIRINLETLLELRRLREKPKSTLPYKVIREINTKEAVINHGLGTMDIIVSVHNLSPTQLRKSVNFSYHIEGFDEIGIKILEEGTSFRVVVIG